jgi:transposase
VLILMEAPSSAYPRGTAGAGQTTSRRGGDLRRFYTRPHHVYGGIDLHARSMYVCILNRDGEIVVHRNMKASPDALRQVIAPSRDDLVVAVECLFTWYWLADLCAQEGMPFVLGHALYMQAIHGGQAKHDTLEAHTIAGLLRGGMRPHAYG